MIRSESTTSAAAARQRTGSRPSEGDSRYARRLEEILAHATEVFCDKGYEGASMRDLSRATRMSLAGLYYYFESKEKLLYLIQKHTFSTIIERARQRLAAERDPEQRIRIFIQNHLEYFLANQQGMKVLTHEDEALKDKYADEVRGLKRDYYKLALGLVEEFWRENRVDAGDLARVGRAKRGSDDDHAAARVALQSPAARRAAGPSDRAPSARIAVLSLFGMMNWIYTWHNPRVDADAAALAQQMADIFLDGIRASAPSRPPATKK